MRQLLLVLILALTINTVYAKERIKHSVLLLNETTGMIELDHGINDVRPIASLTKLMTAIVSLEHSKDMTTEYLLTKKMYSNLPAKKYTREELLTAMLVRSDNGAAETMAENYPGGKTEFVRAMNSKAKLLGMLQTNFDEPTGLSRRNTSTASDVAKMIRKSSSFEFIKTVSIKKQAIFETIHKKQIRQVILQNTNKQLLFDFDNISVSKTGFTIPAGFCLGLAVEKTNQKYIVVILGAKDKTQRLDIAKDIMYNHVKDQDIQKYEDAKPFLWSFKTLIPGM